MGGDWQQYLQSVFIGLLFSFLLAKLISIVVSFREDNLHITRPASAAPVSTDSPKPPVPPRRSTEAVEPIPRMVSGIDTDSMAAEVGSVRDLSEYGGGSDDDWEGVESTELDELFSAATAFVAATAADKFSQQKVPTEVQLQLYGLYKIATEGPCTSPQPSALKMTARAKWQAWQRLGAMPPEDAMQKYIDIITELYPSWASAASMKSKHGAGDGQSTDAKGPMGPVFSSFVHEEESENDLKMDAIHAYAREGEVDNLLKCVESGVLVNLKDSEGRTPLHWAVDRGHTSIVEVLIERNADINAKDNDGQTPLHYAAVCEREAIAELLVKHGANIDVNDIEGSSPRDICGSKWPWMQREDKHVN